MADQRDNPTPVPQQRAAVVPTSLNQQTAANNEASARAAEESRKTAEDNRKNAEQQLDEESQRRNDANIEAERKRAEGKPTPTQRENDLAKLGQLDIDSKEDDGSGPEQNAVTRRQAGSDNQSASYKTRDATPKK